jgi:hypothetical protein
LRNWADICGFARNYSQILPRPERIRAKNTNDFQQQRFAAPPHGRATTLACRMESAVSDHKFKIGQSVHYTSGPYGRGTASGVYKITQVLPVEGDDRQYRIKSANEPHERVVKESQLARD